MMEKYQTFVKEHKWQCALSALIALICGSFLFLGQTARTDDQTGLTDLPSSSVQVVEESSSSSEEKADLVVDVKGAVKKPGLYSLKAGGRVNDAVQAAGGLAENADPKSINLAQKLSDEAVIYVATVGEDISVVAATSDTASSSAKDGKVNLNTATEADLQTISGIGAKKAADILAYRDANGGFKSVDDLKNVSGIGEKSLEKIRPYVTVD